MLKKPGISADLWHPLAAFLPGVSYEYGERHVEIDRNEERMLSANSKGFVKIIFHRGASRQGMFSTCYS